MSRPWLLLSFLLTGFLSQRISWAQTPMGSEIRVNDQGRFTQFTHAAEATQAGDFLVTWQSITEDGSYDAIWGQWYSPSGLPMGKNLLLQRSKSEYFEPALGPGPKGGISVFWRRRLRDTNGVALWSGEIGSTRTWASPPSQLTVLDDLAPRFIRQLPQGGYVIALIGSRRGRLEARTFLLFTDAEGRYLQGPRTVFPAKHTAQNVGSLSVSPSGNFLVTWSQAGARARVLVQMFSPAGRPLGSPVQVHEDVRGRQYLARSAPLGDQGFVVVWQDEDYRTGRVDLKMRFLDSEGKLRGPVQRVNEEIRDTHLGGQIAADKDGNFLVVWEEGGPPGTFGRSADVWGRLFRPDGRPVGPKRVLNSYNLDDQIEPFVAAGANGTFFVVWQSYGQDGDSEGIFGQMFAASPADEVCALDAEKLRCDLGRSGGKAELTMDLSQGGEAVFGDWDGDGRQDPCSFAAGSWKCDLDHFGAPEEAAWTFGQTGDRPLLGDLDGDGRAEACVQRGTQLLCDTARDGGESETTLTLGQPTDAVSFADVDGDGKDEACVIRGASFLCDTGHDGGGFEWSRAFGSGTGKAVFGDANGDGKAEPCVLDGTELLCDSAQDGGAAETRLSFPLRDRERLVLVNLDGL